MPLRILRTAAWFVRFLLRSIIYYYENNELKKAKVEEGEQFKATW